jgi:Mrp family chromosome partitioning ATPase
MPTFSLASQPPAEEKAKDKPSPYPVGELYRHLRKNVLTQVTASPAAMAWICPTGSEPLAEHLVGLASALAETCDGEILLVDANFQSSALTKRFNLNEKHGLADLLTKKLAAQAAGHETAVARVRVLPKGGDSASRASRRASEEEWKSLLAGLKERYRYVLIEAPGVEEPHCIPLSKAADATFVAVALDHTPRETVQEALEHLHLHRARVAGCVVTEAPR